MAKKLRLNAEALAVESFQAEAPVRAARETVVAHAVTAPRCTLVFQCGTAMETCYSGCSADNCTIDGPPER